MAPPAVQLKVTLEELKVDPATGVEICAAARADGWLAEKSARTSRASETRGVISESVTYQV